LSRLRVAFPSRTMSRNGSRRRAALRPSRLKPGFISGYAISLAAPRWVLAAAQVPSKVARRAADLRELELVQALLLLHLQEVDDEVDGQSQSCGAGSANPISRRLRSACATIVGAGPSCGRSSRAWNGSRTRPPRGRSPDEAERNGVPQDRPRSHRGPRSAPAVASTGNRTSRRRRRCARASIGSFAACCWWRCSSTT